MQGLNLDDFIKSYRLTVSRELMLIENMSLQPVPNLIAMTKRIIGQS